jgi:hypothetical protein
MSASASAAGAETVAAPRRARPYSLAHADWLKLWKRRGLFWTIFGMTIGAETIAFSVLAILHAANPAHHGPAGGIDNLAHGMFILNLLGAVAATIVGASAGSGDLSAGVFRELVVTGRSRLALFAARIPGGLAFLLPFTAVAYAIAAVVAATANGFLEAPSVTLMTQAGLWVLAEAAFYFLVGLGLASLTGSRAYTIGILLAWRLILGRILMSIGFLGVFREVVPDVSFTRIVPAGVEVSLREGPHVPASLAAAIAVLVIWVAVWLSVGAWRTVTRDA